MERALGSYLARVDSRLRGLTRRRRALLLRELKAHLLDEAEARGIDDEAGMASMLDEKEPPEALAQELCASEGHGAQHRSSSALAAGMLIGLATGVHMLIEGWHWYICLPFAAAQGLAVGTGFFWVRRRWVRLGPMARLLVAVAITTLLSIPLGFTTMHGFKPTRLIYGAYTGYLLERHSLERPLWQGLLEPMVFTALVFFLEVVLLGRIRFSWWKVPLELSFNATLLLSVLGALKLKRILSERWVFTPQEQN